MTNEQFDQIYTNLTGVDIEEQKELWDERGKGYYGEYLVFKKLFFNIDGAAKFLMNLHLPTDKDETTEVDLMMIHETGIYVFEIKHYKGTIYGSEDDETWTQYFRTVKNNAFKNPIAQNEYHIHAVKRLIKDIPVYSIVVFSDDLCDLRVKAKTDVCSINALLGVLKYNFNRRIKVLDINKIDEVFQELSWFSPMQEKTIEDDNGEYVPFYNYIHNLRIRLQNTIEEGRIEVIECVTAAKKKWMKITLATVLICVVIGCFWGKLVKDDCEKLVSQAEDRTAQLDKYTRGIENELSIIKKDWNVLQVELEQQKETYEKEIADLKERYEQEKYAEINGQQMLNDIISRTPKLRKSVSKKDTVVFGCSLKNIHDTYGLKLNENTKFKIKMVDGTTREYQMFGERLTYSSIDQRLWGKSIKSLQTTGSLKELEIPNVRSQSDIKWIKITNVSLWDSGNENWTVIADGLDLELYRKSN